MNALKAVEEPMFINARRKFTSMVKPIDQRGRAEPGWIYNIFFLSERVIGLVRVFSLLFFSLAVGCFL